MNLSWRNFICPEMSNDENRAVEVKINRVLSSWLNTPHIAGQQCKGAGVDCVQLVGAFLDEMCNAKTKTKIPRLPQTTGMSDHDFIKGAPVLKAITDKYPADSIKAKILMPGDIIVCRLGLNGGPGHAMIVAGQDSRVVHACNSARRVVLAGIGSIKNALHIYRVKDRSAWCEGVI